MPIRDVGDALRELKSGTSKHIRTRKQAIAVGLSYERKLRRGGSRKRGGRSR